MAFDKLSPIGGERSDFQMASQMALLANINRDPKKTKAFDIPDFMPNWSGAEEAPPDPEALQRKIMEALGGA